MTLAGKGKYKIWSTLSTSATTNELRCSYMLNILQHQNGSVLSTSLYVPSNTTDFYAYQSGIYNACYNETPNHAVTLIGNDEKGNWLIMNSWGVSWG